MRNSSAKASIDVGTVIADTYLIEGLLGHGGMGSVFLASHQRLPGKKVAIKVLHTGATDGEVLARFRREAEIATRLGHANIVAVHDFNALEDGTPYLVLEYLEGETLDARIARGPMPIEEAFPALRQIASALHAAHAEQIVHRDLKPSNIFLCPIEIGGTLVTQIKVLDFGISKIRGSATVKTQESALLGTPQYMSPEQATGRHDEVDGRTDVFALAAIAYEMFAGQPAFVGASIPEVVFKVVYEPVPDLGPRAPGITPMMAAAIMRGLEKKADDRYPSTIALVEAITGEKLASVRSTLSGRNKPAPVLAGGRDVGFDATMGSGDHRAAMGVASTVGSGDHGPAIAAARAPANTAAGRSAGIASTALAQTGALAVAAVLPSIESTQAGHAGHAATETRPVAPPAEAPKAPGGKRTAWIALGGVVIAAGIALAVLRPWASNDRPTATAPTIAAGTLPTAAADAAPAAAPDAAPQTTLTTTPPDAAPVTPDAGPTTVAAKGPGDAKPDKPDKPDKTTSGDEDDNALDEGSRALVQEIKDMLQAGKIDKARQRANKLEAKQPRLGKFWRAVVACADGDMNALSALGRQAQSARVQRTCAPYKR